LDSPEAFTRFAADITPSLQNTAAATGAEIIIGKNIIDIYGTHSQTKQAYAEITAMTDLIKIRDTKFQLELSLEHKDFINGKKNGKINRITKTSGCRIAFQESIHDVNMLIDIYSAIPSCLLAGIQMLEEELPAEMSFHIPESFHKRIIGVGGKNIQKIMKRFGVYVKFSNTEEYESLGGYYENADNVICRTPSKNQENLKDLKASIVEAVNATDLIETRDTISLPRQLYQWICGDKGENLAKIQQEFRVRVYMPDKESGSDEITLEGPESSMEGVKERLQVSLS
jgi:KH domain